MTRLLQHGEAEVVKASVHGALAGLAAVCCLYNAAAFALRRERHLAANMALYGALVAVELCQIARHAQASR